MEPDKNILVGDNSLGALLRVGGAFSGGNRSVLSAAAQLPRCVGSNDPIDCCTGGGTSDGTAPCVAAGTGPDLPGPQGVAVDPQTGVIFVGGSWVVGVDPVSGNRTVVSSSDITSSCTGGEFGEIDAACCTGLGTSNGTPPCADAIIAAGRFGVNMLAHGHENVSAHFAGRPVANLAVRFVHRAGTPLLDDACARIAASLVARHDCGDHTLFIGRILHVEADKRAPLVVHASRYASLVYGDEDAAIPSVEFW